MGILRLLDPCPNWKLLPSLGGPVRTSVLAATQIVTKTLAREHRLATAWMPTARRKFCFPFAHVPSQFCVSFSNFVLNRNFKNQAWHVKILRRAPISHSNFAAAILIYLLLLSFLYTLICIQTYEYIDIHTRLLNNWCHVQSWEIMNSKNGVKWKQNIFICEHI